MGVQDATRSPSRDARGWSVVTVAAIGLLAAACGDDASTGYGSGPQTGLDGAVGPLGGDGALPMMGGNMQGDGGGLGTGGDGDAPLGDAATPDPQPTAGAMYTGCVEDPECASSVCATIDGAKQCSKACTDNAQCPSAAGGDQVLPYCAAQEGVDVCALACPGGAVCPGELECINAICQPTVPQYTICDSGDDCASGHVCGAGGFCTSECPAVGDCDLPPTGSPTATCYDGYCALNCGGGCPDGMMCNGADYCVF